MGTVDEKLAYLEETKTQIKNAINSKDVEVTDTDTFRSYAEKIEAIPYNAIVNATITSTNASGQILENITKLPSLTINTSSIAHLFNGCNNLLECPDITLEKTYTATNNMFYSCAKLETVPLFDTSKVTTMASMFSGCSNLTTTPLYNTSSVTNMSTMFNSCKSLTTVPLFDTSSVTNMNSMFYSCSKLETVPQLDTSSVTNMNSMFSRCSSLTEESLNNILAMCTSANGISTKTLSYIGLSTTQREICKTLSNYEAFIEAGWTA